jgi:hypothetical protein
VTRNLHKILMAITLCLLLCRAASANADEIQTKVDEAGIAIGVAGAAIGIGIYLLIRHDHSLTGCAINGPNGLELYTEGNQQTYALIGDVAAIKSGDRVRVSGKKKKQVAGSNRPFLVEKLSKDFGPCKVVAGAH